MTILTCGVVGVLGGGVLIGAGQSLITSPLFQLMSDKCIRFGTLATDMCVEVSVSIVTAGLGAGGSVLARSAKGAWKFVTTLGSGTVAGMVSEFITETANVIKGAKSSVKSYVKSITMGAISGLVGEAMSKMAGVVSRGVTNGVAKAATRAAANTASGAACATAFEAYEAGGLYEMDGESWLKVGITTATDAVVAGTTECTRNSAIKMDAYARKMDKGDLQRLPENVVEEQKTFTKNILI